MSRVKRSIVPFLLGVAVGVMGLMGYQYVGGSPELSILQHLQGDSASASAAEPDSATRADAAPDTLAALDVDTLPAVSIDTAGMPTPEPAVASATGGVAPVPDDTVGRLPPRRLAKFFGSMQAREASRVLEKMTDSEVETILTQLGDREAASILSNLTPERAAQISQVVISGERSAR